MLFKIARGADRDDFVADGAGKNDPLVGRALCRWRRLRLPGHQQESQRDRRISCFRQNSVASPIGVGEVGEAITAAIHQSARLF